MRLMLSFNRNMLALFLAANLLTGAVNLSINTLAVGRWGARSIVGEWQMQLGCIAASGCTAGDQQLRMPVSFMLQSCILVTVCV
jgi:multisubunit Na+/H+ antiporter MnhC subunit